MRLDEIIHRLEVGYIFLLWKSLTFTISSMSRSDSFLNVHVLTSDDFQGIPRFNNQNSSTIKYRRSEFIRIFTRPIQELQQI